MKRFLALLCFCASLTCVAIADPPAGNGSGASGGGAPLPGGSSTANGSNQATGIDATQGTFQVPLTASSPAPQVGATPSGAGLNVNAVGHCMYSTSTASPSSGTIIPLQCGPTGQLLTTASTSFVPGSAPTLYATTATTCNPCSSIFSFVPLSAGKSTYLLSFSLYSSITQTITLEYGTGTNCATGPPVTMGPFAVTAGSAIQLGYTVIPSGQALCILPGASGVIGIIAMGYQQ